MKQLLGPLLAILSAGSLGAVPLAAMAATVTFTDTVTLPTPICVSKAAPASCAGTARVSVPSEPLVLDINSLGFQQGSTITAAKLTLYLADDGGSGDGSEKLDLSLDGIPAVTNADANHDLTVSLSNFSSLEQDGQLSVALTARTGDFFLEGATLTVWDDPVGQNPVAGGVVAEPATLVLLGSGLVALAGIGRKRRARQ